MNIPPEDISPTSRTPDPPRIAEELLLNTAQLAEAMGVDSCWLVSSYSRLCRLNYDLAKPLALQARQPTQLCLITRTLFRQAPHQDDWFFDTVFR